MTWSWYTSTTFLHNVYFFEHDMCEIFFSWQLISGTGSPNGTTSVRDSPISALGHGSSTTSL